MAYILWRWMDMQEHEYSNFQAYRAVRLNVPRERAYDLIRAATTIERVYARAYTAPQTEWQARPLTSIKDPDERGERRPYASGL